MSTNCVPRPKPCCPDAERHLAWEERTAPHSTMYEPKFEWRFTIITRVYLDDGDAFSDPINYCPWCGTNLEKPFEEPKQKKGTKRR